jgi:hypothetical protein
MTSIVLMLALAAAPAEKVQYKEWPAEHALLLYQRCEDSGVPKKHCRCWIDRTMQDISWYDWTMLHAESPHTASDQDMERLRKCGFGKH